MKLLLPIAIATLIVAGFVAGYWPGRKGSTPDAQADPASETPTDFYAFTTHTLLGEEASLDAYRGRICLVVNVASKCGLTPQYKGLQALQDELGGDDFTVLAFPSNDFGGQEPGTPQEIATFCEKNYGVTFPVFEKMPVTGEHKSEIYRFLSTGHDEPDWNFTKYLIGRDGSVIERFGPKTTPDDPALRAAIDAALKG